MYQPFIIKLPKADVKNINLSKKTDNIITTPILPYQLCSLGFHYFIKRTRESMDITTKLQTTIPFYYVVNPFENIISNYEDDINNSTKNYLKIKTDYNHEFHKMWETLFVFDLASTDILSSCILSNNKDTKDVITDVIDYLRQKTGKKNTKDQIVSSDKDMNLLKKNNCDLIIGHSKVESENSMNNYCYLEQENYLEILKEIIHILKYQKEKGNAILQIYDVYTNVTIKLLYIISAFYDEVFVYKPFMSRPSDMDKYIILKGFKDNKELDNLIKILELCLSHVKKDEYITDLLLDFIVPKDYYNIFKFVNIKLANIQQNMINNIIIYIRENDYFGDKFHDYKNKQIESSTWWITNFYPPSQNLFEKNKDELIKLYKTSQEKLNLENNKFLENLM